MKCNPRRRSPEYAALLPGYDTFEHQSLTISFGLHVLLPRKLPKPTPSSFPSPCPLPGGEGFLTTRPSRGFSYHSHEQMVFFPLPPGEGPRVRELRNRVCSNCVCYSTVMPAARTSFAYLAVCSSRYFCHTSGELPPCRRRRRPRTAKSDGSVSPDNPAPAPTSRPATPMRSQRSSTLRACIFSSGLSSSADCKPVESNLHGTKPMTASQTLAAFHAAQCPLVIAPCNSSRRPQRDCLQSRGAAGSSLRT